MEVQLQELLTKIQNEGIKEAEKQAQKIKQEAEKNAAEIIWKAKKQAEDILARAKNEAYSFEASGKQAVMQAGRDLILELKARITELFNAVIQNELQKSLKEKVLEDIITTLIKTWVKKGITDIEIMLSPADKKRVKDYLFGKMALEMKKGITIKPIPEIKSGFRIMEKNGTAYFNITDSGIAECLSEYLNPKLASLLEGITNSGSGD